MKRLALMGFAMAIGLAACADAAEEAVPEAAPAPAQLALGPVDGHDLPGTDLERVQVGHEAPDFTLEALGTDPVTLSSFRGDKNVILSFYRGQW